MGGVELGRRRHSGFDAMKFLRVVGWAALMPIVLVACAKREPEPEPIRAVRTQTVALGQAGAGHEYAADVRARSEVRLGFRVGGKLTARPAELGARVKAGQLLAQLDPEDMRQGQDSARAAVTAAQANAELAGAELRRYKELREQGFISGLELERRSMALTAAQTQLEQARAQAVVQGNMAAYTRLVANGAGVITAVEAEPGSVLAAGTPVLRLALDGPRDVVFAVPEDAAMALKPLLGQRGALAVRLWGASTTLPATLRELSASADPVTRTFQAKADVGQAPVQLGQTATVLVAMPRVEGIVKLPLSAITRQGDKSAVWLVDKATMTVRQVPVVVAGAEGNEVLVASGLSAGQEVVTAGVHVLTPGQKVKFYNATPAVAAASASKP
jgi:membrane fusion protein, multidrug efflux system